MFYLKHLPFHKFRGDISYRDMDNPAKIFADTPFHNWVKIGSNLGENDKNALILH